MVQAPTGIGKTISTLYPALRAMGEGDGERVFYLTARTTTRRAAWQALDLLPPSGKGWTRPAWMALPWKGWRAATPSAPLSLGWTWPSGAM